MSKKKVSIIAQFPPPMHGLSKAVETLYNSNITNALEFEKINITDNKHFFKNLKSISKSKADLFYFTISQTKGGNLRDLIIFKLLEIRKKKCLIHLHGGYYRNLIDNDLPKWQRSANYNAVRKLSGAIVLGKSLKSIFEGMLSEDKIFIVPNCVDDDYLMDDIEFEKKITTIDKREIRHVLYLSNFIASKGYPEALKLAMFEKKCFEISGERRLHFDFAGKFFEKSDENYFFNYIRNNNLDDYVTYHGTVYGKKKRELLIKSDIFVLLTSYPKEGQPISILEAMGNGMMILTTNHAGIPDIVEDGKNGILLDKSNINLEDCHNRLRTVASSESELSEIIKNNRSIVTKYYNQETYINNLEMYLQRMIKG